MNTFFWLWVADYFTYGILRNEVFSLKPHSNPPCFPIMILIDCVGEYLVYVIGQALKRSVVRETD